MSRKRYHPVVQPRAIWLGPFRVAPFRVAPFLVAGLLASTSASAGPLAPLPGTAPDASAVERLSRGVVTVERDGHILAVGTVLSGDGDGRILTALSPLGAAENVEVRYADASVVRAHVAHRDKSWDLALLVPLSGKWVDGLTASTSNPTDTALEAPVSMHPGRPAVVQARLRGVLDARAKDSVEVLPAALDVELRNASPTVGAPVTDTAGGVVGVFVRACQATLPMVQASGGAPAAVTAAPVVPPCAPIVVAAPIAAIHAFLTRAPLTAVAPSAWLGIVGVPDAATTTHGVRVMAVAPDSPAAKGGLKANAADRAQADLIVAVDSQPVDTPELLADIISRHGVGERVKLLVLSQGRFHEVVVALRPAP